MSGFTSFSKKSNDAFFDQRTADMLRFLLSAIFTIPCVPALAQNQPIEIESALLTIIETVDVAAAASGVVTRVSVAEGMLLTKGQEIARVNESDAQLKYQQAKLNVTQAQRKTQNKVALRLAKKAHELAVAELDRAKRLNTGIPNSVSEAEMAVLQLRVERTSLEIEQAEHNHNILALDLSQQKLQAELAKNELRKHRISSPLDGMVVQVGKRVGEWVEAGELVARVVRVNRVRAEGFVKASAAVMKLVGQKAVLHFASPEKIEASGRVVFVSPEATGINGDLRIWAEFENPDLRLVPGLQASMRIESHQEFVPRKRESPAVNQVPSK